MIGTSALQSRLAELERGASLRSSFAARCEISLQLEAMLSAELDPELQARAVRLTAQLDAADARLFSRLRSRLRAGRFSRHGLLRGLRRHAAQRDATRHHSPLDVLLAGLFDAGELPDELPHAPEMVAYQPAPGSVILRLLDELHAADVVYDLGSGLGRVVLAVALLTAARAKGVEFQPAFCAYASQVAEQLNASRAEFVALDARDAHLHDGTVFFLYTPFRGALLRVVLDKLRAVATGHAIRVCTFGPCTAEVLREPWLRPRGDGFDSSELAIFDSRCVDDG